MQPIERIAWIVKIGLVFLMIALLNLHPAPFALLDDFRAARVAQQAGQPADSADALRRVMEREPWRGALWEQIGRLEMDAARFAAAVQAFQSADQAGSLTQEGRLALSDAYLQVGDQPAAETVLQSMLNNGAAPGKVYERLVQLQRARGDLGAARSTLSAWHSDDQTQPQAAYLLGLFLSVTQPEQALPLLLDASRGDSTYTPAVQTMRRGLAQANNAESPAYGWLMIGRSLGSIGEWDLAAAAFERSVETAPDYGEAWAFLAEARYQVNGSGKTEIEHAHQLAPDSMIVRVLLALYWRRSGDPSQALEYLQAIAEQEPDEPIWQVEMANTLIEIGDLQAALEYFQRAVKLAPDNSLYWQYLARFSAEYSMDQRGNGLPAARNAVILAPDDPAALDAMGQVMLSLGDEASAERFLQQAVDRDATYAPAYLHLGQIYLLKDGQRAHLYLKQAADLAGATQTGKVARRLLKNYFGEGG